MITLGDPAAGDRARFRVLSSFGGTAVFEADFHSFVFAPHAHDTLMLGLILEGEKSFRRGRTANLVGRGGISVVNPGDMHTGGVVGGGKRLRYVAVYPGARLLEEAGLPEQAGFRSAVVEDPALARVFAAALSRKTPEAEAEEALLIALSGLGARCAETSRPAPVFCRQAFAGAVDYIEAALDEPLRLEDIAARAGVGPRHLIRCFRDALGLTPQQYVRQARVRAVAALLRRGERLAEAAAAVGFADQPHMTRSFRAVMGLTPAAYASGWARRAA